MVYMSTHVIVNVVPILELQLNFLFVFFHNLSECLIELLSKPFISVSQDLL